ncbi:hypothetical protein [Facilibium subflavum]|uniref:hypothetical protein n=1 Tax=Facilibium subflavum TaxID=2219058 RepID=UPI000E64C5BD|nr:hypothetical protein [Facilibium subflavum]
MGKVDFYNDEAIKCRDEKDTNSLKHPNMYDGEDELSANQDEENTVSEAKNIGLKEKIAQFKFERIYIGYAIAIIVICFGVYFILSPMLNTKENTASAPTKVHRTDYTRNFTSVAKPTPVIASVQKTNIDAQQLKETQAEVAKIIQQNNQAEKQLISLAQTLKTIKESQSAMLKTQKLTVDHLKALQNAVSDIQQNEKRQQLTKLIDQLKRQIQYLNAKAINVADQLHLTAVVDGVAWLEDNKGKTMIVKKGDTLEGYGRVMKVDDEKNRVYTESGYVFK